MDNAEEEARPPIRDLLRRTLAPLQDRENRHRLLTTFLSKIHLFLRLLTGAYLIFLLFLCVALHWFAETNITLIFITFLPATIWLLPLAALFLLSLPISWHLALLQGLAAAAYIWFYMDFEISASRAATPKKKSLTILTYNRGQHRNQSFEPFVSNTEPDIIVLQEAYGRAQLFRNNRQFSDYLFVEGKSDFVVLSKYPLGKITPIPAVERTRTRRFAARFEVDFDGTPIALYAVHQPTLRDTLGYYRRGSFLFGLFGIPGTSWGEIRAEEEAFWAERTSNARKLSESIANDELPAIAAGDFNMPDHGAIYRAFANRLNDAHEESGRGFGYTFPGHSEGYLTVFGPWLRLDYIFSAPPWKTINLVTETDRASQHRAVAATLTLDLNSPGAKKPEP